MANPEFKKTILIGLGGAGQQILLNVKRLLLDTFGAVPPSVKLLSLDTDSAQSTLQSALSEEVYRFGPGEYFHLTVRDPKDFIEGSESVRKWYVLPMPVGAISNGAGAVRQNGRLALFKHIAEFLRRLDNMTSTLEDMRLQQRMANAKAELGSSTNFTLSQKPAEVYVCGSLAGGTGSGTFLDVGILLRDAIPNALIHGYFLLHWPFRNKAWAHRVRGNVYAALSELDNIQSLMYGNGDFSPYEVEYAGRTIKVDKCPYDLCHLIDGRNERGETINEVDQLCETVGNALFLGMSSMAYRINSVTDNLLQHINVGSPKLWNGRYARYSSIGVGSIYYPARELHRCISANSAVALCEEALAEALSEDPEARARRQREIEHEFGRLREGLGLRRELVADKLCPPPLITFELERGEIADTEMLQSRLDGEEQSLVSTLQGSFEARGRPFIDNVLLVVRQKIADLETDATRDTAYRQSWIDYACSYVSDLSDQVTVDANKAELRVLEIRAEAARQLGIAAKARYIPLFGGARKSKVDDWQQTANEFLGSVAARTRFEFEKGFYANLLEQLAKSRPAHVPTAEEFRRSLGGAKELLRKTQAQVSDYFTRVKEKAAQLLVGEGQIVVLPGGRGGLRTADSLKLDYGEFKLANGIKSPEDYLRIYEKDPYALVALFARYSEAQWAAIEGVGVQEVLEAVGREKGIEEVKGRRCRGAVLSDPEMDRIVQEERNKYMAEQVGHLFRVSSALWHYNRGRVTEVQDLQYDRIVNIGVYEQASGAAALDSMVQGARQKVGIRADHSFSSTGNPWRIWLLNYAAALPVYFLTDLQEIKQKYEDEMMPTYHIDKNLEMNIPDLFPVSEDANTALRILAMAIVPGIDVVLDDYQRPKGERGHVFTCTADAVRQLNFGLPMSWTEFRTLYADVSNSAPLRKALAEILKTKVASIPEAELHESIKAHIGNVKQRLGNRDFSRLVSARLTYREIKYLESFLEPVHKNGFGRDIGTYISGKR